jgi:hypothetical protein
MKKNIRKTEPYTHYPQPYGMKLCAQNFAPGECVDDPVKVTCALCRKELHRLGIQITKTHYPDKLGVLCKIQNDKKRFSDIVVTDDITKVTCGNCRRIARDRKILQPRVVEQPPAAGRPFS